MGKIIPEIFLYCAPKQLQIPLRNCNITKNFKNFSDQSNKEYPEIRLYEAL